MCDDPQWKQRLGPPSSHRYILDIIFVLVLKCAFYGEPHRDLGEKVLELYWVGFYPCSSGVTFKRLTSLGLHCQKKVGRIIISYDVVKGSSYYVYLYRLLLPSGQQRAIKTLNYDICKLS